MSVSSVQKSSSTYLIDGEKIASRMSKVLGVMTLLSQDPKVRSISCDPSLGSPVQEITRLATEILTTYQEWALSNIEATEPKQAPEKLFYLLADAISYSAVLRSEKEYKGESIAEKVLYVHNLHFQSMSDFHDMLTKMRNGGPIEKVSRINIPLWCHIQREAEVQSNMEHEWLTSFPERASWFDSEPIEGSSERWERKLKLYPTLGNAELFQKAFRQASTSLAYCEILKEIVD